MLSGIQGVEDPFGTRLEGWEPGGVQEVPDLPTCFEQVAKSCKFMLNLDNFGQFGDDFEVQNRFG